MARVNTTRRINLVRSGKRHHGFTLVELIVVLAIIAIVSAVGVVSIFSYIKKSNFEQNCQNAVSVYQATQNALSLKTANGTQDSWTRKLVEMKCSSDQMAAFEKDLDKDNESNTMKLSLTFNPNSPTESEDAYLYNLLSSQFYDKTIFNGTLAVELDVVATYSKGYIYYTAGVSSAFYCKQNDSETGWSSDCIGDAQDGLPQREPYSYRRDTSLVGWFDGTADSVTGPDGVCPVKIPPTLINDLDGHILADSTDEGYLVNLRNGETLDVSWAIFDTDGEIREFHEEKNLKFTLISEGTNSGNAETYSNIVLSIDHDTLENFINYKVKNLEPTIVHECVNNKTNITRYERTALIDVKTGDGRTLQFPLTISKVLGDDRVGCPDRKVGYYEYRLSLDCMVIRSDEGKIANSRFNGERLFGTTPRNISATFSCTFNRYIEKDKTPQQKNVSDMKAARAIDDPVYFTGVSRVNGSTTYCYVVKGGEARYDEADNSEAGTTGKCVVNTAFGDLKYDDSVGGTSWTSQGGDAVITSFRHLYNIRWIQSGTVNYRIVRDLDWYTQKNELLTVSDVKVFKCSSGEFGTPASITNANNDDSSTLKIVSFPAIHELRAGQTLTSMSKADGKKFSINNLQMRTASFVNDTDEGYGMICKNSGTIFNIYTNNFNMVLSPVSDMEPSDYDLISATEVTIATESTSCLNNSYYIGGLVGLNEGNIGNSDADADDNENVIMMSNPIIMASPKKNNYWLSSTYPGVGGIIGKNAKDINGILEISGKFVVVGNGSVGGAIAYSNSDIGARIVVDGKPNGSSQFTLPVELTTESDKPLSCVIAGTNHVGGAIGFMESCSLTRDVSEVSVLSYDPTTGRVEYSDHGSNAYQIYVNLPDNSLILEMDEGTSGVDVGGAIGYMYQCGGEYMSVYVENSGNILIRNKNSNLNEVGGAIGYDNGSIVAKSFLTVINGDGAVGSFLDDNVEKPQPQNNIEYCGGAYGLLENVSGRTIYLDVTNNGTQISAISNSNGTDQGSGGAIGVLKNGNVSLIANVVNNEDTKIVYYSDNYSSKNNGAGGAIGAVQNNDQSYLVNDSHVFVENNGYIYANYNVGGVVGVMGINHGGLYAYNNGATIKGNYCVGGAVGWSKAKTDGSIQSILSGATVSGAEFIGGAIGRNPNLQGGNITTKVYGASTVRGTGSVVGGVCGDVSMQGDGRGHLELNGNKSKLTVAAGGKGVGGVAGVLRANDIVNYATVKAVDVVLDVSGSESVGGAIGRLRTTSWSGGADANAKTEDLVAGTSNKTARDIMVSVDVVLPHPSRIVARGPNVGGAIGFVHTNNDKNNLVRFGGYVSVRTESGSSDDSAYIRGTYNVGGAIGHFGSIIPDKVDDNSKISVDFTDSAITIEAVVESASDAANLGGAVGFFDNDGYGNENCEYVIDAELGSSFISTKGSYVGGAIGHNKMNNGCITVSSSGTITGNDCVAGGIGFNEFRVTSVDATFGNNDGAVIYGTGNYVGGAVGKNLRRVGEVSVELYGGSVISGGYFDDNDTLQNGECIGGALGYSESELSSVTVVISGDSIVDGGVNIGGAIGHLSSNSSFDVSVGSVSVTIENDNAISGYSKLGGAIGRVSGTKQITIDNVSVEMNAGYPIKQGDSPYSDACIGGVIGLHNKGTVNNITLSGTGGWINTMTDSKNSSAPYRSYDNGLLITGKGEYLGGIIGKAGGSNDTGDPQTNSKLVNISATGPAICVVSSDNSRYIGGWIGGCYSTIGGADTNNKISYDVNTVKVVFSKAEFIGGVFGTYNRASTYTNTYMKMTIGFSEAIISGRAAVGGAFGELSGVQLNGRIDMTLENGTRIGDFRGDLGDGTDEEIDVEGCYCVEAGGIAGRYSIMSGQKTNGKISLTISDDEELSMIFAGSDDYTGIKDYADNPMKAETAGVGGVFGRVKAYGNNSGNTIGDGNCTYDSATKELEAYAYLISSSRNVAVFAYASNAGGFVGYLPNGTIKGCFSTAVVKAEGQNACAGGFVGRMDKGYIGNSFCGGHTVGGQYIPLYENIVGKNYVGGFVGYIGADVTTIYQCYSTASVRGENYVGGFAGYINGKKSKLIDQVYCTGYVFAVTSDDDTEVRYYGSFAGYVIDASDAPFNNSKVVEAINKDKRIVGNIETTIGSGKLMLAKWNGSGNNYIRINASSIYHKTAFDSVLQSEDVKFPLRTFVSVQVNGKWEGIHYGDWPIIPKEQPEYILTQADVDFADGAATVFSGSLVEPEVVVTKGGVELEQGTNYSVVYWRNNKIGKATVIIVGTDPYYGTVTKDFDITSADINSSEFTIDVATDLPYNNNEEIKPDITITYKHKGIVTTLVEGKDYTLAFENNTEPGQATVKITGIGNYVGEVEKEFTILPLYTVNFEAGGETVYVPQRIVKNGVVERPADPTLTGHIFIDWYKDEGLTEKYNFADPVLCDTTIYAKWTKEKYEVTFVVNGGIPVDAQTVEYNDCLDTSKINEQEKTDCTFVGWYSDEECTKEFDLNTPITGAMTLYALWKDKPLVTYTGSDIPSERIEYNSCVTKPENPTKEHFTFAGWYQEAGFENEFDFSVPVTEDVEIFAKWIANPIVYIHLDTDNINEQEVAYEYDLNDMNLDEPDKAGGYRFVGWFANEECTVNFDFDKKVTEDVHIYAKWIKTYTITVHLGDGENKEITVDQGERFDYKPTKDGYVLAGWFTDEAHKNPIDIYSIIIDDDYTIFAKWDKAWNVTVVISEDEEEIIAVAEGKRLEYTPEREGYSFQGWYEDDQLSVPIDMSTIDIYRDYKIYAKWEEE